MSRFKKVVLSNKDLIHYGLPLARLYLDLGNRDKALEMADHILSLMADEKSSTEKDILDTLVVRAVRNGGDRGANNED